MLKRLAYLTTASVLLLLAATMFWCVNRLNVLTLAQQQTQRQITQWRDQPQPDSDYHELKVAVKNITDRTEALARQLNDAASTQAEQLQPINEQIKELERQIQTLSTSYQHLQQQSATRSRAKAKSPIPSALWAAKAPFSLIGSEFRAGRQFAVIAPSGYRSLSQLQLVAPGDSVQGWQLLQLDGSHATFRKGGQRLMLNAGG
ncbi:keratin [Salmonella enterica subsp. salamae]|nr:keratin [Salmonella enterica subsp. salamae]